MSGGLIEALYNTIGGAATTITGAFMGRLMWHTSEVRRQNRAMISKDLIWEVPVLFGMVLFGEGVTDYFKLGETAGMAVIVALAYLGPRGVEAALVSWFAKRR